jgi:4'-phosphopantetheinyl transferase
VKVENGSASTHGDRSILSILKRMEKLLVNPLPLTANEIHIWKLDLTAPLSACLEGCDFLDVQEKFRFNRFQFQSDRSSFRVSHNLLRLVLAAYLGTSPASIVFQYGACGKPRLSDLIHVHPGIVRFNLSHSKQMVLIALAANVEVGVDIEAVLPQSDWAGWENEFLNESDRIHLESVAPAVRQKSLFQIWVAKEAFLKTIGSGLACSPKHVFLRVMDANLAEVKLKDPGHPPQDPNPLPLQVKWLHLHADYAAALCHPIRPGYTIRLFDAESLAPWLS